MSVLPEQLQTAIRHHLVQMERQTAALESIARSVEKLANPMIVVKAGVLPLSDRLEKLGFDPVPDAAGAMRDVLYPASSEPILSAEELASIRDAVGKVTP